MKKPPIPSILLSTLLLLLLCFDIANAHNHGHDHKHTLPPRTPTPKPNLPSCASLEKLNHTLTRISPILEKVLHLDTAGGTSNKHKHGLAYGHGHSHSPSQFHGNNKPSTQDQTQRETRRAALRTRDDTDAGIARAMERSKRRVAAGMMKCQGGKSLVDGSGNATAKSLEGMRRRWVRKRGDAGGEVGDDESDSDSSSSSSSSSSDSDSDSDDDSDSDSEDEEEKGKGQCTLMDVLDNLVTTLECLLAFTGGVLDGVLDLVLNMLAGILDLVESSLD